jgi:hypothetical protein
VERDFPEQTGLWQVFGADAFEVVPIFQTSNKAEFWRHLFSSLAALKSEEAGASRIKQVDGTYLVLMPASCSSYFK